MKHTSSGNGIRSVLESNSFYRDQPAILAIWKTVSTKKIERNWFSIYGKLGLGYPRFSQPWSKLNRLCRNYVTA